MTNSSGHPISFHGGHRGVSARRICGCKNHLTKFPVVKNIIIKTRVRVREINTGPFSYKGMVRHKVLCHRL